jgi:hypothetical protein
MGSINPEREARRRGAATDPLRVFERDFHVYASCQRPGCEHRRELTVSLLLRVFGPAATLGYVSARLRCSKCENRGARIEVRYIGRRGDGR